jgi:hypothetical protein
VRVVRKGQSPVKVIQPPVRSVSVTRKGLTTVSNATTNANGEGNSNLNNNNCVLPNVSPMQQNAIDCGGGGPSNSATNPDGLNSGFSSVNIVNNSVVYNSSLDDEASMDYSPSEPNDANYENYVNSFVSGYYENENSRVDPAKNGVSEKNNDNDNSTNNDSAYVNYVNSLMFSLDDGVK